MTLFTTLFLLLSISLINAQSNMVPITWSSVVYTYYGEITPTIVNATTPTLTPLGATQLYNSGSIIRDRYLNSTATQLTLGQPINGLSDQYIINNQLQVWSTGDEYVVASAQAFMQGLYPPVRGVQGTDSVLANGSVINYPLGGYQYPNINSLGEMDYNYIWIAGNGQCRTYDIATEFTKTSHNSTSLIASTEYFYLSLANTFFAGIDTSMINYGNAIDLYYHALYQYNHNSSIADMPNSLGLLQTLNGFASEQAISFNTPSTGSSIQYIAGQTFASKIIQQFQQTISSSGISDKLSLYFGSYEPMLAFFYLSSLSTSDVTGRRFSMFPDYGSVMAFELFSYVEEGRYDSSTHFPNANELWVRFIFRNGTSNTDPLISYPLFNLGNSEVDMKYNDFVTEIGNFAMNDLSDWCSVCASISLFCEAILSNESSDSDPKNSNVLRSKAVNGVVGGIIGAIVTLVVLILVALILALLGFRMQYREKKLTHSVGGVGILKRGSSAGGGGFKGPEKLASDTDLNIVHEPRVGATVKHERAGSWEMGNAPGSNSTRLDKGSNWGHETVVSVADYNRRSEDGIGSHDPWGMGVQGKDYV
ncbi:d8dca34b-a0a4-45cb-ae96-471e5151b4db [Sclerotinia trifoliorum]|uniref:D8dca34b-a0a4-45cb-ae96-471e5151b4db n=1 Tax=Sclerotinia trifoliorum TaxID=28548 RepID=A0A8H2ZSI0_9HELO|nr:d8dca34b-a0a4-45cb-ae96-471e5151b4db [Sclerotinia trifoliorum]